jgi:hypothetical protein
VPHGRLLYEVPLLETHVVKFPGSDVLVMLREVRGAVKVVVVMLAGMALNPGSL